eukprot:4520815-Amphidinium_carterae.1
MPDNFTDSSFELSGTEEAQSVERQHVKDETVRLAKRLRGCKRHADPTTPQIRFILFWLWRSYIRCHACTPTQPRVVYVCCHRVSAQGSAMFCWTSCYAGEQIALPARKRHRKKAFLWCGAVDQMLKTLTGQSLTHWHRDEEYHANTPPNQWPMLNLVADQGSDGMAGANYLVHHCKMNVMYCADPCHRAWNDCKQALKRSHLWETVLGSCVLLNYPNGPWKEQRFHRRNQEVMQEFLSVCELDDGIVGELCDHILRDHQSSHHRCDEDVLEQVR